MNAAGGNFGGGSITNSVVDSGNVYLSRGTLRNTVIKRGGLSVFYAKAGGTFTIDGGSIEDSPGTAIQFGSPYDSYDPALFVIRPPRIVRSRSPHRLDANGRILTDVANTGVSGRPAGQRLALDYAVINGCKPG
jgi:hypothetical protein